MKFVVVLFALFFASVQAQAVCKPVVKLKSQELVLSGETASSMDSNAEAKIEFVRTQLANKTVTFSLKQRHANQSSETCVYSNPAQQSELRITRLTNSVKVRFEKYFFDSTLPHDEEMDTEIYDTAVRASGVAEQPGGGKLRIGNLKVTNDFHYFETCGWLECTTNDKSKTAIGVLKNVEIK